MVEQTSLLEAGPGAALPTVGAMLGKAFKSTGRAVLKMPLLFISAYVGIVAVTFAGQFLGYEPGKMGALITSSVSVPDGLLLLAGLFASNFINALFLAPLAVAMHRFILRDEVTRGVVSFVPAHTREFIVWLTLIAAVRLTAYLPAIFSGSEFGAHVAAVAFLYAFVLVIAVIGVRISLLFPAVAIDAPSSGFLSRATQSWRLTRGHFWYTFGVGFLLAMIIGLPVAMVVWWLAANDIASAVVAGRPHLSPDFMIKMMRTGPMLFLATLQYVVITATAAAGLSWIYRALAQKD